MAPRINVTFKNGNIFFKLINVQFEEGLIVKVVEEDSGHIYDFYQGLLSFIINDKRSFSGVIISNTFENVILKDKSCDLEVELTKVNKKIYVDYFYDPIEYPPYNNFENNTFKFLDLERTINFFANIYCLNYLYFIQFHEIKLEQYEDLIKDRKLTNGTIPNKLNCIYFAKQILGRNYRDSNYLVFDNVRYNYQDYSALTNDELDPGQRLILGKGFFNHPIQLMHELMHDYSKDIRNGNNITYLEHLMSAKELFLNLKFLISDILNKGVKVDDEISVPEEVVHPELKNFKIPEIIRKEILQYFDNQYNKLTKSSHPPEFTSFFTDLRNMITSNKKRNVVYR